MLCICIFAHSFTVTTKLHNTLKQSSQSDVISEHVTLSLQNPRSPCQWFILDPVVVKTGGGVCGSFHTRGIVAHMDYYPLMAHLLSFSLPWSMAVIHLSLDQRADFCFMYFCEKLTDSYSSPSDKHCSCFGILSLSIYCTISVKEEHIWPLNNTDLNCVGLLMCGIDFSVGTINVFALWF